jgi:prepilin-type N-terminal cleavage/methylation domain-containing protein
MVLNFYSKRAFTLVELLVVIAIIGLLSTVVLVSTSGLREQAEIAKILTWTRSAQSLLGDSAIGIWNLDEDPASHGSTIYDLSGWGNNGVLYTNDGTTDKSVLGVVGNALSFDGTDDYVEAPILTPSNVTVEAWIKINAINLTDYPRVVSNLKNETIWKGFEIYQLINSRAIHIQMNVAGTFWSGYIGTPDLGEWTHVAFTFDGSYVRPYFNGIIGTPQSFPGTITYHSVPGKTYISKNPNVGTAFNGLIDEVRIYNTALTASQIQSQYYTGLDKLLTKELIDEEEYQARLPLIN